MKFQAMYILKSVDVVEFRTQQLYHYNSVHSLNQNASVM